jgi:phospholipid/cholesterol/gamma-HCH transport system substrate-binding protein
LIMSKSRLEWRVGLFVLVGLVLLCALLLQFSKGTTFGRPTYRILLRAANVSGLKVRSQVLMAGVQVGSVSDVRLSPQGTNVTITLRIFSQYQVHKDARFAIETSGFLGDQYVAILPTQNLGDVYQDGEIAQTEPPFNIQEVARSAAGFIQRIDETARKLNDAISDVRRLVLNEQTLTNLSAAVRNLRVVSEKALGTVDNLNALVSSNSPALSQSGSNLVQFSDQINLFAGDLRAIVSTNRVPIQNAVKNIESSTEVLKDVIQELQAGKGLAGSLLKNEELATNVSRIAENLSITSSNLNRLGLWGILWQKKPARVHSPTTQPLSAPKYQD